MILSTISLRDTGSFSQLLLDYLDRSPELGHLYNHFPDKEGFARQIQEKVDQRDEPEDQAKRQILVDALSQQYSEIPNPPIEAIEHLAKPSTFTITTGHQLNLATGPLYFMYKIIHTLTCCRELQEQFPEYHFQPIYWMASEDHDFEEIQYFRLFGKKYTWESDQTGAVGRFDTTGLEELFKNIPEFPEFMRDAYLEGPTLAHATRKIVHHLFGDFNLLCLDADDASLKALFKPVISQDVLAAGELQKLVESRTSALEGLGYSGQIYPREINFFYLEAGKRNRIIQEGANYSLKGGSQSWSRAEMEALIESHPERFSPNVVLRPVYQEIILPNLAYIGGPSEVAYWFQLGSVFEKLGLSFPILMPRHFVLFIPAHVEKRIRKLKLQETELFLDKHSLKKQFIARQAGEEIELGGEIADLANLFERLKDKAKSVDPTLEGFVGSEHNKSLKSLQNIEKRIKKVLENRQKTEIDQLFNVKDKLFPEDSLQERYDNFLNIYLNYPEYIPDLIHNLKAFDFVMHIVKQG